MNDGTIKWILADTHASRSDIERLRRAYDGDILAIGHPNCPADVWFELAENYPIEATRSVLFPAITQRSPYRWRSVRESNVESWLAKETTFGNNPAMDYGNRLTYLQRLDVVCTRLEASLYLLTDLYPRAKSPAIVVAGLRSAISSGIVKNYDVLTKKIATLLNDIELDLDNATKIARSDYQFADILAAHYIALAIHLAVEDPLQSLVYIAGAYGASGYYNTAMLPAWASGRFARQDSQWTLDMIAACEEREGHDQTKEALTQWDLIVAIINKNENYVASTANSRLQRIA